MSTELITRNNSTGNLTRSFIRDGVAGNYDVIYAMVRLVRQDVEADKGLEDLAKGLLISDKQDAYTDAKDQLQRIFDFVVTNVRYIADISGRIESLKDARQTLSDGYGDCDDHTVLIATLLGCIGFEDVRIAMARYAADEKNFAHVYPVAYDHDTRYVLDTTLPNPRFDTEVKAVEIKEIPVFTDIAGLDGIGGLFNNSRHYAKKIARAAVEFAPRVADTLPLGFVASEAFATGAQMIGHNVAGKQLSFNAVASKVNKRLDVIIANLTASRIALDIAKTQAIQAYAQLAAVEYTRIDTADYEFIKENIKNKIGFIKNFKQYADANGIKVVNLNAHAMLVSGIVLTGGVGYLFWKGFMDKKRLY